MMLQSCPKNAYVMAKHISANSVRALEFLGTIFMAYNTR